MPFISKRKKRIQINVVVQGKEIKCSSMIRTKENGLIDIVFVE
jgi:hypothetical protein